MELANLLLKYTTLLIYDVASFFICFVGEIRINSALAAGMEMGLFCFHVYSNRRCSRYSNCDFSMSCCFDLNNIEDLY